MESARTTCPGCGLELPPGARVYEGDFHASPECWSVFTEVLEREFSNAAHFRGVFQRTVGIYVVRHARGLVPQETRRQPGRGE